MSNGVLKDVILRKNALARANPDKAETTHGPFFNALLCCFRVLDVIVDAVLDEPRYRIYCKLDAPRDVAKCLSNCWSEEAHGLDSLDSMNLPDVGP